MVILNAAICQQYYHFLTCNHSLGTITLTGTLMQTLALRNCWLIFLFHHLIITSLLRKIKTPRQVLWSSDVSSMPLYTAPPVLSAEAKDTHLQMVSLHIFRMFISKHLGCVFLNWTSFAYLLKNKQLETLTFLRGLYKNITFIPVWNETQPRFVVHEPAPDLFLSTFLRDYFKF